MDYLSLSAHFVCRRQTLQCPEGKSHSTQSEFAQERTNAWTSVLTRRAVSYLSALTVRWQCGLTTPRGRPLLPGCRPVTEQVQRFRPVGKQTISTTRWKVCVCLCVIHMLPFMYSHPADDLLQLELTTRSNHSVSISWRKYETARQEAGFVVEWYPEGYEQEELSWVRLGRSESSVLLTGGKKFKVCFSKGKSEDSFNKSIKTKTSLVWFKKTTGLNALLLFSHSFSWPA